jgi:hypothetical protein
MIARAMAEIDKAALLRVACVNGNSPSSRRRPGPMDTGLWNLDPGLRRDDGRNGRGHGSIMSLACAILKGTFR